MTLIRASRGHPGPYKPRRSALLLRRRQALRRDPVLRLPPPARHEYQGGAHLQHLRPAHAPQRRPRAVSNFIVQALQNKPITLYGDGTQSRSFCYVDDLIEGFVRLMNSPGELTGPINLGNPGEFTMIELAETILELTGSRSSLIHEPLPQDDPRQRQPDITAAKSRLGWEPKIPLRDGLRPTIAYFDTLLSRL